jgi:hypothetical protein
MGRGMGISTHGGQEGVLARGSKSPIRDRAKEHPNSQQKGTVGDDFGRFVPVNHVREARDHHSLSCIDPLYVATSADLNEGEGFVKKTVRRAVVLAG